MKKPKKLVRSEWDLNQGPLEDHPNALPTELRPLVKSGMKNHDLLRYAVLCLDR